MTDTNPIRVLVVDDHDMVRKGLGAFLRVKKDLELVGEASNGQEAIDLCDQLKPDVILMDLVMPAMDGVMATQIIHKRYPHIQVIALTSFKEEDLVQKALQAGAISYLLKNVSADDLAEAIRSAHAGRPTLAPEAAEVLVYAAAHPHKLGQELTGREQDVLTLMVEGLSNTAIGDRLQISRSTVRFHVSNILSKLEAANRAEAVAIAVKHKLVT